MQLQLPIIDIDGAGAFVMLYHTASSLLVACMSVCGLGFVICGVELSCLQKISDPVST